MRKQARRGIVAALVMAAFLTLGAASNAQAVDLGLQGSTNFEDMLVGLKIQMAKWAITPKAGFQVQNLKGGGGTAFAFGFGCGIDYYLARWNQGKLRPYIGNDLLVFINDLGKAADTKVFIVDDIHIGLEYWIVENFSLGGNLGVTFGFAESPYTPSGILNAGVLSDFTFSLGGKLNMTYYF